MSDSHPYTIKYQQLLRELKTTVEGLLVSQVANVWSIYGGLNRLYCCMDKIFKHGCKTPGIENTGYYKFVQGLEWLQPDTSKSYFGVDCEYSAHIPAHIKEDKGAVWLYQSLENHSLSQKLSWLLSDNNHVVNCFQDYAFLCQEKYAEAALICLKAVERNQASLLSEINPYLFLVPNAKEFYKIHRRCSSYPDHLKNFLHKRRIEPKQDKSPVKRIKGKLRPWHSMPNLLKISSCKVILQSKTTPSTPLYSRKIPTTKRVIINNFDIIEHTPPDDDNLANFSIKSQPEIKHIGPSPRISFLPLSGEKDYTKTPKKSFIEDGGMSVLPMATGYFPRPVKGQSLESFLRSSNFTRTNAELDRENAHFSISEAIISAMEQIRCKKDLKLESPGEDLLLKQRIRLRKRPKTVSPSSSTDTFSDYDSSDIDDLEIDDAASSLFEHHGLSVSMASLYSEADVLKRGTPDGASDIFSAEGVALSLISKFNEKQLPRASDLEWLVSEEDVPQALLPMPSSWPISPDDSQGSGILRGTFEWAPPRPQIIFTIHRPPARKVLLAKQNHRCAGCSMKVASQYASKFRYCDYLGRYFCTGCHTNQLALIPGRVLQKWDFSSYPVSSFSYRLLEQMYSDPLFRVFELNKHIWKMSKNLQFCRKYRNGLYYLKNYIYSCKFTETIIERLSQEKNYILNDPEVYSLEDLVNVRKGDLKLRLKYLVELCFRHVSECKLCDSKGFNCEICNRNDVIFPWQMKKVINCSQCGGCYHIECWVPNKEACPKCVRISKRKEKC